MAKFRPSQLFRPERLEDVLSQLSRWGSASRLIAGNTTIYEFAREGALADVETLIDISRLDLNYIRLNSDDSVHIGSTTTFSDLSSSSVLKVSALAALQESARKVTPLQIRNMGTIGGALCSGIPFYDVPTTVLALGATIKVASVKGEREIGADDFFVDYFATALNPEDLLLEIIFENKDNAGSSFVKLGRTSVDFAVVNCAAMISLDKTLRSVREARIALGAVSNIPIRAPSVENALIGHEISETLISKASHSVEFEPTSYIHASSEYKKMVIPVLLKQSITSAINRARGEP
jgi:aerobic carbon-monoxide dehydrogenase medium subunit